MSLLSNFKILTKVLAIVVMLSALAATTSWLGVRALATLNEDAGVMSRSTRRALEAARANENVIKVNRGQFRIALDPSPESRADLKKAMDEELKSLHERLEFVKKSPDAQVQALLGKVDDALSIYEKSVTDMFRQAEEVGAAHLSDQALSLRDAAMNSRDVATKLQESIAAVANRLRDRVDENGKAANDEYESASFNMILISALGILFGLGAGFIVGQYGVSRPIASLKGVMDAFARNDLKANVPGLERRDELGEMARSVEVFKRNGLEVERLKSEQQALEQRGAEQRKLDMRKLADQFEGAVGNIVLAVSSSAAEMEMAANSLSSTAETTQELSTIVAVAAGTASTNVQSVAAASEEMTATVTEISRQVHDAARIAREAVTQAQETNRRVTNLSESAKKIGDVVGLISAIAGQTNLLALNATIEAARAGEAGRGFAVVATEVKSLAEQTARATAEIDQQISAIQVATEGSVQEIGEITSTIGHIAEISAAIAAAVEQQGAATQEIAHSVQEAAKGTTQVASNITEVQHGASNTGSASAQVLAAAKSLSADSARLDAEVRKFVSTVRAA
jgi:methyl-accepting chemotaxis protein